MALNFGPYASNAYGVSVQPLEYTGNLATKTTKTYHGVSIVANNNVVGRIQTWNPTSYSKDMVHKYELNARTFGRPIDLVPGKSTGYQIAMTRTEVWNEELEIALGYGTTFNDLADQTRPWTSQEYLFKGVSLYHVWQYSGCLFSEKNIQAYEAEGDAAVQVDATIMYVSRVRLV